MIDAPPIPRGTDKNPVSKPKIDFNIFGISFFLFSFSFVNKIKIDEMNAYKEKRISKFFVLTFVVKITPKIIPKKNKSTAIYKKILVKISQFVVSV